jgi:hypothetical protein
MQDLLEEELGSGAFGVGEEFGGRFSSTIWPWSMKITQSAT